MTTTESDKNSRIILVLTVVSTVCSGLSLVVSTLALLNDRNIWLFDAPPWIGLAFAVAFALASCAWLGFKKKQISIQAARTLRILAIILIVVAGFLIWKLATVGTSDTAEPAKAGPAVSVEPADPAKPSKLGVTITNPPNGYSNFKPPSRVEGKLSSPPSSGMELRSFVRNENTDHNPAGPYQQRSRCNVLNSGLDFQCDTLLVDSPELRGIGIYVVAMSGDCLLKANEIQSHGEAFGKKNKISGGKNAGEDPRASMDLPHGNGCELVAQVQVLETK
jgi:hypothetical protein